MSAASIYANRPIRPGGNAEGAAILTPKELFAGLDAEFHFDGGPGLTFDPCPYPRPEGFDGTEVPWGESSYVNPPFGPPGFTAWVRKALEEREKGHTVVLTMPVYGWIARLLEAGAEARVRRDWWWETPAGERRKPSQPLVAWVLRPVEEGLRLTPTARSLLEAELRGLQGFWNEAHRKAVSIGFGLRMDRIFRLLNGKPEPDPKGVRPGGRGKAKREATA